MARRAPGMLMDGRSLLGFRTGIGRYAHAVASRLPDHLPDWHLWALTMGLMPYRPNQVPSSSFVNMVKQWPGAKAIALTVAHCQYAASTWRPDVVWAPNFAPPSFCRAGRLVVTVHDFSWHRYPEWHPAERVRRFASLVWPALRRADCIITVSEAIRQETLALTGVPAKRVVTIPNGVDTERFRPVPGAQDIVSRELGIDRPYVLAVGSLEPRKNLMAVLDAWDLLPMAVRSRCSLVVAGASGWRNAPLVARLRQPTEGVRQLGFVADELLPALYSGARALVYVPIYEGFGLPVLEALACGCPVICTPVPALEILSDDGVSVIRNSTDGSAIMAAIQEHLADVRLVTPSVIRDWNAVASDHARTFTRALATDTDARQAAASRYGHG